jgi:hypothetical protein
MTFDKDFKHAISQLPSGEKDKLIFRLLKYDLDLARRLHFELLATDNKEDRREKAKKDIEGIISIVKVHIKYSTPGIMMMEMRSANGIINDHVKITKDKYGEVYLQIFVLNAFLQIYHDNFKNSSYEKTYTLNIYIITKVFKIMVLIKKMHEDVFIDFVDDLKNAGHLFASIPGLMKAAIHNGLDINWLINENIPDDIDAIEKDLRKRGYLK